MRYVLSLLAIALLEACATRDRTRSPTSQSPGSATGQSSGSGSSVAQPKAEKIFRSGPSVCLDAALRACRARDYGVIDQSRTDGGEWVLSGEGRGFAVRLTLAAMTDHRTRVLVVVEGRAPEENRDEAMGLLDRVRKELLEPLD